MIELIVEEKKIAFLLDTGFNGHLMLPKKIINKLNLEIIGSSDYTTASGEINKTQIFKAKLKLFGKEIEVPVLSTEGGFSLAGMELFNYYKIIIEKEKNLIEISETNTQLISKN